MDSLASLPLSRLTQGLRRGDFSAQELTQACIDRIEQLEPQIQAFITVTPELALAQADAADQELTNYRKSGSHTPPHPLTGIPMAIKDVLATRGVRTTAGSRILENFIPPYSATAVERLLQAGMVLLGKTNTDEFAMGSSTENSAFGTTRNPWKLDRVPGGSSGGSAAAVAARMSPIALGTDTGGSIRQPASFCGVTGLKPTYGRVSRYGLIAYGSSLDCVGVLGKNADEVAEIYRVIAGHDPRDATCVASPYPPSTFSTRGHNPEKPLKGLRVGVPQEYFAVGIQRAVETAVREAIAFLERLGAEVQELSLPHTHYALPVYYIIAPAEASANLARFDGIRYGPRLEADSLHELYVKTRGQLFGPEVKRRIMLGTYALSAGYYDAYYKKAQKVRTLIRNDFKAAFSAVDVLAAPVTPTTAFHVGQHRGDPLAMYLEDILTLPANLASLPSLALPIGFDHDRLPVGMQLIAPPFQEELLIHTAAAYQQATNWAQQAPSTPPPHGSRSHPPEAYAEN